MSKVRLAMVVLGSGLLNAPSGGQATILGPDAAKCASGAGPALLVTVVGLKSRLGAVRARTFDGANRKSWFDKKMALRRTQVTVPSAGPVEICMPVPKPGGYVVDIRHDANGNDDTDRSDGAGASGNPDISLFSFMLGSKPPASKVVVNVGPNVTPVTIVVKYIQGGSFKPIQSTSR
jgi:uncharacterized protein (DUF2141 family)